MTPLIRIYLWLLMVELRYIPGYIFLALYWNLTQLYSKLFGKTSDPDKKSRLLDEDEMGDV